MGALAQPAQAQSACPTQTAVATYLADAGVHGAAFSVHTAGDEVFVVAGRETRAFADPARDCSMRAKWAAVLVQAMLTPPSAVAQGPAALGTVPGSALGNPGITESATRASFRALNDAHREERKSASRGSFWLGAATVGEWAPGDQAHNAFATVGLGARGLWLPDHYGASFGFTAFLPTTFRTSEVAVAYARAVFDLSAHAALPRAALDSVVSLGPALELHDVRGVRANLGAAPAGAFRALAGVRAAWATPFLKAQHLHAAVEVSALWLPRTGALALHTAGVVGREPSLFLGLGLSLRFQP
jgi:hypothetical protein